jgi:hypothetical protein
MPGRGAALAVGSNAGQELHQLGSASSAAVAGLEESCHRLGTTPIWRAAGGCVGRDLSGAPPWSCVDWELRRLPGAEPAAAEGSGNRLRGAALGAIGGSTGGVGPNHQLDAAVPHHGVIAELVDLIKRLDGLERAEHRSGGGLKR